MVRDSDSDLLSRQRRAIKFAIIGLLMAGGAIAIDAGVFWGIGSGGDFDSEKAMNYSVLSTYVLFPTMIAGLILLVVNLYRFIRYKIG